jgi:hypothetical protein
MTWDKYSFHNNVSGPGAEFTLGAENALSPRTVIVGRKHESSAFLRTRKNAYSSGEDILFHSSIPRL